MKYSRSILDTDLYKFTTSYAYMQLFPRAIGTFTFIDRNKTIRDEKFLEKVKIALVDLENLKLTESEKEFMIKSSPFVPQHYWEWLERFRFSSFKVDLKLTEEGYLSLEVTDYLYSGTLWEVHILALISEVHNSDNDLIMSEVIDRLIPKIKLSNLEGIRFSEFGTRRRFSYDVQKSVVKYIAENSNYCVGTSNCHFAHLFNLKPIGTFPHEWVMFHGAMFGYKQANYMALENWSEVYDGDLGIALTDTYSSKVFFDNFSKKHAKLFDGVRQDSGDEFKFVTESIKRYKEHKIDPISKTIIFSNALDFEKALEIKNYCHNRVQCAFGIGTNLTNDTGYKPSNIVMKLTKCSITSNKEMIDCVKLSDDHGKYTGSKEEVDLCRQTLKIY